MPILILILIALFVVIPGIRVVNQYERGVVQRLGRFRRMFPRCSQRTWKL